ncbi:MAG: hypothetical protein Q9164_007543 [Protoblastenia rupestris]
MAEPQLAPFPFLSLPRELRDIVYGYYHPCLSREPIRLPVKITHGENLGMLGRVGSLNNLCDTIIQIDTRGIALPVANALALVVVNKCIANEIALMMHKPTYIISITDPIVYNVERGIEFKCTTMCHLFANLEVHIELLPSTYLHASHGSDRVGITEAKTCESALEDKVAKLTDHERALEQLIYGCMSIFDPDGVDKCFTLVILVQRGLSDEFMTNLMRDRKYFPYVAGYKNAFHAATSPPLAGPGIYWLDVSHMGRGQKGRFRRGKIDISS